MIILVNGAPRHVSSTNDVLQDARPDDELVLVVERTGQPGVYAQAAGSVASGFVVAYRDATGTDHTTTNHALRPTTVAAMLDGYVRNDPAWVGTVSWADDAGSHPASGAVVRSLIAGSISVVASVVAVSLARTYLTVAYLCGRNGDEVVSVNPQWGSRWSGTARSTCTFADGERVELSSVAGTGLDLAESIGTTLLMLALVVVLWVLLGRVLGRSR